jgi:putative tryptophan/tyrosine transport system substrate-binding protein
MIARRKFIGLVGGAAAAWPLAARAQGPGRAYRLGVMVGQSRDSAMVAAFFDELRLLGFVEGQNLAIVAGGFGLLDEQRSALAAEIVKLAPDVIWNIGSTIRTRALRELTQTIPIVTLGDDMLAEGTVQSLARPGGNITGISLLSPELDGKRQDILIDAVPGVRQLAALADSKVSTPQQLHVLQEAARARSIDLAIYSARTREDIIPAMDQAKAAGAGALNVLATPLFASSNRGLVMGRATALRLPAMYQWPEMAEEGGFAAYGPRLTQIYRQEARLVAKILHGAKPADLPVEQPARFEFVINLQAARVIDHDVPASVVLRADKVIE